MNSEPFSIDEFIPTADEADKAPEEVDVQRAVVEELAADKVELEARANSLSGEVSSLKAQIAAGGSEIAQLKEAVEKGKAEIARLQEELEKERAASAAAKMDLASARRELALKEETSYAAQERNPNALALLDRDVDLPDRFPGETRDHVLEVIKEARNQAEADGRIRLAQVLEGVLVSNEPNGSLAANRAEMKKLFAENMNIVNGNVIEKLKSLNIPYKDADNYLSAEEILKRNY